MKIGFPLLGFGRAGGHRVISKLSTELINLGHEVYLVVPDDNTPPYYPTKAKIIRTKRHRGGVKIINVLMNYLAVFRKLKELNLELVIANHHLTSYIVILLPKKIKKVYYVQAYEVVFFKNLLLKLIAYITYKLPLKKVVNNAKILPPNIKNILGVVPAGIDNNVFFPNDYFPGKNKTLNIGLIGRAEKHKGTFEIIKALIAWKDPKDFKINIAVNLNEATKKLLEDSNANYELFIIENDQQLAEFYRLNELFIATGLVEDGAFHYPCAEAMACGCIVISNYSPLVDNDSPYKVLTFDQKEIINKLQLFEQSDLRAIQKEIKSNLANIECYSWKQVARLFNDIILEKL